MKKLIKCWIDIRNEQISILRSMLILLQQSVNQGLGDQPLSQFIEIECAIGNLISALQTQNFHDSRNKK